MKNGFIFRLLIAFVLFAAVVFGCTTASSETSSTVDPQEAEEFRNKVNRHFNAISLSDFSDSISHARYVYPDSVPPWKIYDDDQILGIAENMIYLQNPDGGWAKNYDWARKYSLSELKSLQASLKSVSPVKNGQLIKGEKISTMDNRNIFSQIIYLAEVFKQVPDDRYRDCMNRALDWILNAQHPTSGGFTGADVYAITYNDDVMADALSMLKRVATGDLGSYFSIEKQKAAAKAYENGIQCILKTQIKVNLNGEEILTAWCQQHDHDTLKPVWARTFEPPSITACESISVLNVLMDYENPTEEIKHAVIAACEWLNRDDIRIHGKKVVKESRTPETLNGRYYDYENVMYDDASAKDMWARFYSIDDEFTGEIMKPIWCDRDRAIRTTYNDLSKERRNGYGYVGTWPNKILTRYEKWKSDVGKN